MPRLSRDSQAARSSTRAPAASRRRPRGRRGTAQPAQPAELADTATAENEACSMLIRRSGHGKATARPRPGCSWCCARYTRVVAWGSHSLRLVRASRADPHLVCARKAYVLSLWFSRSALGVGSNVDGPFGSARPHDGRCVGSANPTRLARLAGPARSGSDINPLVASAAERPRCRAAQDGWPNAECY